MKIIKREPQPTYNLIGVSHDEMTLIAHLLARAGLKDDRHARVPDETGRPLFMKLFEMGFKGLESDEP